MSIKEIDAICRLLDAANVSWLETGTHDVKYAYLKCDVDSDCPSLLVFSRSTYILGFIAGLDTLFCGVCIGNGTPSDDYPFSFKIF